MILSLSLSAFFCKKRHDNTDCLKILNKMLYINCGKYSINIIFLTILQKEK